MDRGAEVVHDAAVEERGRAQPAAEGLGALVELHRQAGPGQHHPRREPVGPGAHDGHVDGAHHRSSFVMGRRRTVCSVRPAYAGQPIARAGGGVHGSMGTGAGADRPGPGCSCEPASRR